MKKETTENFINRLIATIEKDKDVTLQETQMLKNFLKRRWQWLATNLDFLVENSELVSEAVTRYNNAIEPKKAELQQSIERYNRWHNELQVRLKETEELKNRENQILEKEKAFADKRASIAFDLFKKTYDYIAENTPKDYQAKQRAVTAAGNMATAYLSPKPIIEQETAINEKEPETPKFKI